MTERGKVRVTVFSLDSWDWYDRKGEVAETLERFVCWANGLLSAVPLEYRGSARIDFDAPYDESGVGIDVYYERPETDDEMAERIRRTSEESQARLTEQERQERAILAALVRKYGKGEQTA